MPPRRSPFKTSRKKTHIFSTTTNPQILSGAGMGSLTGTFRAEMKKLGHPIELVKIISRDINNIEIVDEESRAHYLITRTASAFEVNQLNKKGGKSELRKTDKNEKSFLRAFRTYMEPWHLSRKKLALKEIEGLRWFRGEMTGIIDPYIEGYARSAMKASLPPIYAQALETRGTRALPAPDQPLALLPFSPK